MLEKKATGVAWLRAGIGAASIVGGLAWAAGSAAAAPRMSAMGEGEEDPVIALQADASSASKSCKCPASDPIDDPCDYASKINCASTSCQTKGSDGPKDHTCEWK